jgi:TusA-related sulfurtransferase
LEPNSTIEPTSIWDAGDMGCGELIVVLRERILALEPGQVLRVIARDPGAPEDLPAWSRLDSFAKAGGTIYVCSPCFKKRGLDEARLVDGAKIVGGAKLVEWLASGSPCVSY